MQIAGPFHGVVPAYPATSVTITTPQIQGDIKGVALALNGATSADFTITTKGVDGAVPVQTILDISSVNADGWYYPHIQVQDVNGADIADLYAAEVPVYDQVVILIENAQGGDEFDITFMVED